MNGGRVLSSIANVIDDHLSLPSKLKYVWIAGARGKPSANSDIQNSAESTRMIADPDFEILGTGASSDDVTYHAEGGIKVETDGTDGNGVVILPHLDANQTGWSQTTWGTDQSVRWECRFVTGSAITTQIIWVGLKETNTATTITDDDQVFFRYEDDVNSGKWQAISSIDGTDDAHDTGVTVVISTAYHMVIDIDSARVARFYINDDLVETSGVLEDAIDLIPYMGIEEDGASSAAHWYVRGQAIERNYA